MRTFRLFGTVLVLMCLNQVYAQESKKLILQYHGLGDDPYKQMFIDIYTSNHTVYDEETYSKYYTQNRTEILRKIDSVTFSQIIANGGYVEKAIKRGETAMKILEVLPKIIEAGVQGYSDAQEKQAQKEAIAAERQAQFRVEQQARVAQNKQKYAEFQAMTNKKVSVSNYQTASTSAVSQGSYSDLLTSDPNWNQQVQMWVHQYGVEKTREIVKQKRNNDYQQSIELNKKYSQEQTANNMAQNSKNKEIIISAVTSSRKQVYLKITTWPREIILSYSDGLNEFQEQDWKTVVSGGGISKRQGGDIGSVEREFSHTANINGTQVYFNYNK